MPAPTSTAQPHVKSILKWYKTKGSLIDLFKCMEILILGLSFTFRIPQSQRECGYLLIYSSFSKQTEDCDPLVGHEISLGIWNHHSFNEREENHM